MVMADSARVVKVKLTYEDYACLPADEAAGISLNPPARHTCRANTKEHLFRCSFRWWCISSYLGFEIAAAITLSRHTQQPFPPSPFPSNIFVIIFFSSFSYLPHIHIILHVHERTGKAP